MPRSAFLFACSRLGLLGGTAATRKPRWGSRPVGTNALRFAARQSQMASFQPPPRITRPEPVSAPGGSSVGEAV